jgi:hypothetical protein
MKNFQLPSRNSIQIAFKSRFPAIKDISFLQCSHLFSDPYPSPKMAHQGRFSAAILSTILLLCLHPLASVSARAAIFTVGDDSGWTFTIEDWTKGKKFKAGDILSNLRIPIVFFFFFFQAFSFIISTSCFLMMFVFFLMQLSTIIQRSTMWQLLISKAIKVAQLLQQLRFTIVEKIELNYQRDGTTSSVASLAIVRRECR